MFKIGNEVRKTRVLYKILSDCHYVDEINDLLNAFRWQKKFLELTCGDWLEVCKELADLTPETVPAVDGVVAEFTASLADIEKGSSSLAQPRPPLSFLSHCLLTRKLFASSWRVGRLFGWCFCFESSLLEKSADASLMSKCQKKNFIQWNAIRKRPLFVLLWHKSPRGPFWGIFGPKNLSLFVSPCLSLTAFPLCGIGKVM